MIRILILALSVVLAPTAVYAQLQAPNRFDAVQRVAEKCPGLIANDHAFTDAVASVLYAEDHAWGRNGKRGNADDLSHDAIAYRNVNSPFGVSIVDIIGGAVGPDPSPAWIDQTQATIDARTRGVWVAPRGVLPPCLTGAVVPVPNPGTPAPSPGTPAPSPGTPAPSPGTGAELTEIRRLLADQTAMLRDVTAAINRLADAQAGVDLGLVNGYVDDMVGNGPGDADEPNHITDLKQRLDKQRAMIEALTAWLRSRRALGF
jgi:hypothetical protein